MDLNQSLKDYLAAYADKDLTAVSDMFAQNIKLRDWKISVCGKNAAIAETKKNFAAASSIDIEILHIHGSGNTRIGELQILVDSTELLTVVDIVTFDAQGKIQSIRAYLGRED